MLAGRFEDISGRPVIEGKIILPRSGIEDNRSFLMDTGADTSVPMPGDAKRLGVPYDSLGVPYDSLGVPYDSLGVPYDSLGGNRECGGIGGTVYSFVERAILVFADPAHTLYGYDLEIDIMPYEAEMEKVPLLLGQAALCRHHD